MNANHRLAAAAAAAAALLLIGLAGVPQAQAALISAPGAIITPGALTLSGETAATGTTGGGANPTLTLPGSYTYANTFTAPQAQFPDGSGYSFYDAFVFTVGGSQASSVTSTINLGSTLSVGNLYERLYSASTGDSIPVIGAPLALTNPTPASSYFVGWTSVLPGGVGEVSVLNGLSLAPGTYVLEIRGLVNGASGGSYTGQVNLAPMPVPVPAGLGLLLSGLGGLGVFGLRRPRRER